MVQRAVFTVAIACVPCGPRRSLIYACEWGFWVCWKLSAAEQVKSDCCHTPAVVSTLLTPLPVSCSLTTPLHYIYIYTPYTISCRYVDTTPIGRLCPLTQKKGWNVIKAVHYPCLLKLLPKFWLKVLSANGMVQHLCQFGEYFFLPDSFWLNVLSLLLIP